MNFKKVFSMTTTEYVFSKSWLKIKKENIAVKGRKR